jgi:hypothetical protein
MTKHASVESVLRSGTITDAQTLELRRHLYADYKVSQEEAGWLFELNTTCAKQDKGWRVFFVEALSDFIVNQMHPAGYVSEANAKWLMAEIDADGKLESINELELLIAIFEIAKSVPESLSTYALNQVKAAVLSGEGVLRSGKTLQPNQVSDGDVEILRRILYAYGSSGNVGITKAEAEVLFDINDATSSADNHPSWPVLFSQAIANHLMMASGHTPVDRETALRREEWLNSADKAPEPVSFIAEMVGALRSIYTMALDDQERAAGQRRKKLDAAITESEKISQPEAAWLVARINRDGALSPAEQAVLTFIKQESPEIDPALEPLLAKVA